MGEQAEVIDAETKFIKECLLFEWNQCFIGTAYRAFIALEIIGELNTSYKIEACIAMPYRMVF